VRRTDQRRAAVFALYQADVTGREAHVLLERDSKPFTKELVDGTTREQPALDELISRHASGWSLERIAPLERNILRVALYELLHRSDVPDEVAIDEAIEAAKELCSAEAPSFVNGILGAVQRQEAHAG
jgi:transcription antitermination protein NusB